MIITISGMPGSGKSTVGKLVAKRLGYEYYSAGDARGDIAMQRGVTIDELNEIGKKDSSVHKRVDDYMKFMGETKDNMVFDSWVAYHFIPKSVKVFLTVNMRVAAERIFKDPRPDEEKKNSAEEVREMIEKRFNETNEYFKNEYKTDITKLSQYDLVIDTTNITPEQVVEKIIRFVEKS